MRTIQFATATSPNNGICLAVYQYNVNAKAKRLEAILSPGLDANDITGSELYWIRA